MKNGLIVKIIREVDTKRSKKERIFEGFFEVVLNRLRKAGWVLLLYESSRGHQVDGLPRALHHSIGQDLSKNICGVSGKLV